MTVPAMRPYLTAIFILGPYGLVFFAVTFLLKIPEASAALKRLRR
jgi:hypothetical protein